MKMNFYVNEEKGTVTAVLDDVHDEMMRRFNNAGICIPNTDFDSFVRNMRRVPNKIQCRSVCSAHDTFDLHTGKAIAAKKVSVRFEKYFNNLVNVHIQRAINQYTSFQNKYNGIYASEVEKFEQLMEKVNG